MENCLAAIAVGIYHNAVTVVRKALFAGNISGGQKQMAECVFMHAFRFVQRIDMLSGNYQNVCRSLWRKVVEGDANVIFVDFFGRDFSRCDLAEYAV